MEEKENKIKQDNQKSKKEEKVKKHFLKDFKAELKRVVWPTPKQLLNSTIAVITIVLTIGIIVFVLDLGFELLNSQNAKLQSSLQENSVDSSEVKNTTSDNTDEASSENSNTVETKDTIETAE